MSKDPGGGLPVCKARTPEAAGNANNGRKEDVSQVRAESLTGNAGELEGWEPALSLSSSHRSNLPNNAASQVPLIKPHSADAETEAQPEPDRLQASAWELREQ